MRGLLLLIMSLCAVAMHAYDRVYSQAERLEAGQDILDSVPGNLEYLEMNYRVRVPANRERPGKLSAAYEIVWNYMSPSQYCGVALTWINTDFGSIDDRRFLRVELFEVEGGRRSVVAAKEFDKKVNLADGYNSVSVTKWENRIYVAVGGSSEYLQVGEMAYRACPPSLAGIMAMRPIEVIRARLTAIPFPEPLISSFNEDSLREYLAASTDPVEGYWIYLDRKTDPESVVPGGSYTLAIVKASPEEYNIIYLGGADIHAANWTPMRIKGRLSRTGFVGNYDLEWLDADGYPVSQECYAMLADGALLTFRFPLLNSEIRFRKESLR